MRGVTDTRPASVGGAAGRGPSRASGLDVSVINAYRGKLGEEAAWAGLPWGMQAKYQYSWT